MDNLRFYNVNYSKCNTFSKQISNVDAFSKLKSIQTTSNGGAYNPRYGDNDLFPLNDVHYNCKPTTFDPNFNESFSDIADQRAIQLIQKAIKEDKDLMVKFSGGIDSTTVLCAILKWIPDHYKSRFYVALTTESIFENLQLFIDHIQHLNIVSYMQSLEPDTIDKTIIIDGLLVDGLIGWDRSVYLKENNLPYKQNLTKLKKYFGDDADWLISYFEEDINKNCPVPIKTIYEFLWWPPYNGMYTYSHLASYRDNYTLRDSLANKPHDPQYIDNMLLNHTIMFFNDLKFDKWALVNLGKPTMVDSSVNHISHKIMAKQYISDFTKKPYDYVKVGSGAIFHFLRKDSMIGTTNNYEIVGHNDRAVRELLIKTINDMRL